MPEYFFEKGFVSKVVCTIQFWIGEECRTCEGTGRETRDNNGNVWSSLCDVCHGTGRIGANGPAIVQACPVREVVTDKRPESNESNDEYRWMIDRSEAGAVPYRIPRFLIDLMNEPRSKGHYMSRHYPTEAAALAALSDALITWARREAGNGWLCSGSRSGPALPIHPT